MKRSSQTGLGGIGDLSFVEQSPVDEVLEPMV